MIPNLESLVLYTSKSDEMAAFYSTYFGYVRHNIAGDRIVELRPPDNGFILLLHPTAKGQRQGQAAVKLVFTCADVVDFCETSRTKGLQIGPLHHSDGYVFANAKDPSGNSISVSGRYAQG